MRHGCGEDGVIGVIVYRVREVRVFGGVLHVDVAQALYGNRQYCSTVRKKMYIPGTMLNHACCVSLLQNSAASSGANTELGLKLTICCENVGANPVMSPASSY